MKDNYYIIFTQDGRLMGYSNDKNYISIFKETRPGNYKVIKVKADKIPDKMKNSHTFTDYCLEKYQAFYTGDSNIVLFNYELGLFEELMMCDADKLQTSLCNLIGDIDYLKLPNDLKCIIKQNFEYIVDMLSSITESNEILFDDVYNIDKYFYERFLKEKDKHHS